MWAAVGAVVIGLSLGLMGSGGSILTVPVLVYVLGHADKPAIAESLAIVGGIAFIGAVPGLLRRRVDWRSAVLFGVPAVAGTWIGAWVSLWVPGAVQLLIFAIVMLIAAGFMLRSGGSPEAGAGKQGQSAVLILSEGLGVGVLTGLVGVGGGFLVVPALVLLGGLSMHKAVATSLVIIAGKSIVGFWKYLAVLAELELSVDWSVIWVFLAVGGVGAVIGGKVGSRIDQRRLKRAFAVFLIVMGLLIGIRETLQLGRMEKPADPARSGETRGFQRAPDAWPGTGEQDDAGSFSVWYSRGFGFGSQAVGG